MYFTDVAVFSTFDVAYSKLVSSLENSAEDHIILADSLFSQVTDELEKLKRRGEEVGRKAGLLFFVVMVTMIDTIAV